MSKINFNNINTKEENGNNPIFSNAGRPVKRKGGLLRVKKVILNFTEEEVKLLDEKVELTDYNRSEYIRAMLLGEDYAK